MRALPGIDLSGFIARIPTRQRVILGILVAMLAGAGYWHLLLKPALVERDRMRAEWSSVRAESDRLRRIASQKPLLEQEIRLLEGRLSRAVLKLPEKKEIPSLLTRVVRLSKETDLEVSLFKPGNPVPKEFYTEIPVQLKVIGTYHGLGLLFERLGRMERVVTVGDISIRPAGKDQGTGATIQAELGLVTYMYKDRKGLPEREAAPAHT
jgi:type IV pilus assembly protein PilO